MGSGLLEYFNLFLLVFARMGGLVFISPVFSRKGVPARVRTGLALALSLFVVPGLREYERAADALMNLEMAAALIKEVAVGVMIGAIFQIFFYMLYCAGDLLDTVFGLAMGKVMDPVNGVQSSVLGQFLNIFFFLYFFASGCHLMTVRLFLYTYEIIPPGTAQFPGREALWYIVMIFASAFSIAVRLALPFVAAELVLEVTMGVMMKLVPQIHVFVINIQSKIILGMILMLLFAQPVGTFLDGYNETIFREVQNVMMMFS